MPESAYGPTNNCIGVGNILRRRGHTVIFAAEASWEGKLAPLGFVEDLVHLAPPAELDPLASAEQEPEAAGQFWIDFIRDTAPVFRRPTIEQLTGFIQPTWQALIDGAIYCQPQLQEIIQRQRPDVIIEDNVNAFPALVTAGVPFVRSVSCQPLEMKGTDIPPLFSGYPSDDRTQWDAFRAEYDRTHREMWAGYDWSSCTRVTSTSTSTRQWPTTPIADRWVVPGTVWIHRCAPPMHRSRYPRRSHAAPTRRASSSTCRWVRWAAPMWG